LTSHKITLETGRKLSRLLSRPKYQPPRVAEEYDDGEDALPTEKMFVLAEDALTGDDYVHAFEGDLNLFTNRIVADGGLFEILNIEYCLSSPKQLAAGAKGWVRKIKGEWVPVVVYGCPVEVCALPPGTAFTVEGNLGEVDVNNSINIVVVKNVTGSITVVVDKLPDGVTYDTNTYSVIGTPSEIGSYPMEVSVTAGTCVRKKISVLNVVEA
jgi:hypothetical protein